MKVCTVCGDTYLDHIDFCFNDGEVLAAQASALDAPEPGHVDAAAAPSRMQQGSQVAAVKEPAQPARSATPTPRAKRSLLNRPSAVPTPAAYGAPDASGPAPDFAASDAHPPSHPTLIPTDGLLAPGELDDQDDEPEVQSAFSQADTMPIPRRAKQPPHKAASPPRPAPPPPVVQPDLFDEDLEEGPSKVLLAAVFAVAMALLLGGGAMILIGFGLLNTSSFSNGDGTYKVVPATPDGTELRTTAAPEMEPAVEEEDEDDLLPDAVDDPPEDEGEVDPAGDVKPAPPEPKVAAAAKPPPAPVAPKPAAVAPKPVAVAPKPAVAPKATETQRAAEPRPRTEPKVGAVRIRSTPSGATAKIDGKEMGLTPINVDLPVGSHEVVLELSDHDPLVQRIDVKAGDNELPAWTLTPRGQVAGSTKVPVMVFFAGRVGEDLYVDGALVGSLPARLELTEGPHLFEVKNAKSGDFSATREVVGKAGGVRFIHLSQ